MQTDVSGTTSTVQSNNFTDRKLLRYTGIFSLYLLGAIIFTWPLALNLGNRVVSAHGGDVWQHIWHMWWSRYATLELRINPYYTYNLYHPTGVNFYFQALNLPTGLLSSPLQYLFGLVTAFNLTLILNVAFAGFTTFLLASYVTGSIGGALVAGAIYAYSPLEGININQGQYEQMSIGWFPLFLLFFLKFMQGKTLSWQTGGLAALFLAVNSLVSWYFALFGWMFSGLYLLYALLVERKGRLKVLTRFGAVYAGYALLVAVVLVPTLLATRDGVSNVEQPLLTVAYNSSTLKGFFAPGPNPLWDIAGLSSEGSNIYKETYLGYVGLALAGVGLAVAFRKYWFWLMVGLFFIVLSLGPALQFSYNPNLTQSDFDKLLPMPARLLYSLPLLNVSRVPVRFGLLVLLALGILAAVGISYIQSRLGKTPWQKLALPALAGLLVFLEFLPGGRTLVDTSIPDFYKNLDKNGNYAVFEMPDRAVSKGMYFQTEHKAPLVSGYTSRAVAYALENVPGLRELRALRLTAQYQRDIIDLSSLSNTPYAFYYYNIRYLIMHPTYLRGESYQEVLNATLGQRKPCYESAPDDLVVWCFPPTEEPKSYNAGQLMFALGDGWQGRRILANGEVQRDMAGPESQLVVFNPARTSMQVELSVPVRSGKSTNLQIRRDGSVLAEAIAGTDFAPLTFKVSLNPGLNVLTFRASDSSTPVTFGLIKVSGL